MVCEVVLVFVFKIFFALFKFLFFQFFTPTQPRNVVPCIHVHSRTVRGVYHGRDSHVEEQEHSLFSP